MIIACIITYNDMPVIKKTIKSLEDQVDLIVCIDGKFKDFLGEDLASTDGTLPFLYNHPKVKLFICPNLTQFDKRSRYFIGSDGDWYLIIDGDEVMEGRLTIPDCDIALVDIDEPYDKTYRRVRIIKHQPGIHYATNHHTIYDGNNKIIATAKKGGNDYVKGQAKGFTLIHLDRQRNDWRLSKRDTYYASRREG